MLLSSISIAPVMKNYAAPKNVISEVHAEVPWLGLLAQLIHLASFILRLAQGDFSFGDYLCSNESINMCQLFCFAIVYFETFPLGKLVLISCKTL